MLPNNINIQDVYASAAMGIPVTPGLGRGYGFGYGGHYGAYPPHYDTYNGKHGKRHDTIASTALKLSLAILGAGATVALLTLATRNGKIKAPQTGFLARWRANRLGMPDGPPAAASSLSTHAAASVATPQPGIFSRIGSTISRALR
ncbi:MAG: hypothetical protein VKJ04_06860 [Vampirovibrionales bacterium]|nr:hypothetical protein [Vampirovibrionales bacterium]